MHAYCVPVAKHATMLSEKRELYMYDQYAGALTYPRHVGVSRGQWAPCAACDALMDAIPQLLQVQRLPARQQDLR